MIKPLLFVPSFNTDKLKAMDFVKVNGYLMVVIWNVLFLYSICPFLKSGNNHLEGEVLSK